MRLLITIPHYHYVDEESIYGSGKQDRKRRAQSLSECILALHECFGRRQILANLAQPVIHQADEATSCELTVVICTSQGRHVLDLLDLPAGYYQEARTNINPKTLGYYCHSVLREQLEKYDYYCYLEDDLIIHDGWFFEKLCWFNSHTDENQILQPNRYEASRRPPTCKAYIDGPLEANKTSAYQDTKHRPAVMLNYLGKEITLRKTSNPHSGCFFLTNTQMDHWSKQEWFLNGDSSFYSFLESAATLGIMRTFDIYKPSRQVADFLEIQHYGDAWIRRFVDRDRRAGNDGWPCD